MTAHYEGMYAREICRTKADCPYEDGTEERKAWISGYEHAANVESIISRLGWPHFNKSQWGQLSQALHNEWFKGYQEGLTGNADRVEAENYLNQSYPSKQVVVSPQHESRIADLQFELRAAKAELEIANGEIDRLTKLKD